MNRRTLFLAGMALLYAIAPLAANAQPEPETISYRLALMTPGTSSDYPGGFAFGREVMQQEQKAIRWLGSFSSANYGNVEDQSDPMNYEYDTDRQRRSFSLGISRQWVTYLEGSDILIPALAIGPSIEGGYSMYTYDGESTAPDSAHFYDKRFNKTSATYERAGLYATFEINWKISERVDLVAAYGFKMGLEFTQSVNEDEYEYWGQPNFNSKTTSKMNGWELYARTQTVSVGLSFRL